MMLRSRVLPPTLCAVIAITLACAGLVLQPDVALGLDHCGQVTTNQTWSRDDSPHVICSEGVRVRNSRLSIAPGATVRFLEGASLIIESGSRLDALGSEMGGTIDFVGATGSAEPGFWGQIRFEEGAGESRLQLVRITGGGQGGVPMVDVRGGPVIMAAILLRATGGPPVAFAADMLGPSLEQVGQFPVPAERRAVFQVVQPGEEYIGVYANREADVTTEAAWYNLFLPYRVVVPHDVESEDRTLTVAGVMTPTLSINAGTRVEFEGDSGLVTGIDEERTGGLFLSGLEGEPVVLTGVESTPGSWNGVHLTEHVSFDNTLINAMVEYGGRGGRSMIIVEDPTASGSGVQMRHAEGYPAEVVSPGVGSFVTGLNSGRGEEPPAIAENGIDRLLVRAAEYEVDIARGTEWVDVGAPYEIDGDLLVAGSPQPSLFRISEGAHLAFGAGTSLIIGDETHGEAALVIDGNAGDGQVRLTGLGGSPGSWHGLVVSDHTESAEIERAIIEYGGGAADGPMVDWGRAPGVILESTLRGASGYPLAVPLDFAATAMSEEFLDVPLRNTVEDNGVDRYLVLSEGSVLTRSTVWADPGAPVEFDGDLVVGARRAPLLELHAGLRIVLREGNQFRIGASDEEQATARLQVSDAGDRVSVSAADPAAGHGGVSVGADSTLVGEDTILEVTGGGAESTHLTVAGQRATARLGSGLVITGTGGTGTGAHVTAGGDLQVNGPRLTGLAVGARASEGGRFVLERGWIYGNTEYGALNDDETQCLTASRIWWGAPDGPRDDSDAQDGCVNNANAGSGDRVSDDVNWVGYATDDQLEGTSGFVRVASVYLPVAYAGQ